MGKRNRDLQRTIGIVILCILFGLVAWNVSAGLQRIQMSKIYYERIAGVMTLLAKLIEPFLTDEGLADMSLTGSILIFCVGVNLIWGKKVKVANLLPAIFLAAVWPYFPWA